MERNVLFFGNEKSGKRKLIQYLRKGEVKEPNGELSFGLNYSYLKYGEEFINLYEIENPDFMDLLDPVFKDIDSFRNTIACITLDVEEMSSIEKTLDSWFLHLKKYINGIFEKFPPEQVKKLKEEHQKKYQSISSSSSSSSQFLMDTFGENKNQLGIPLFVILCKSHLIWDLAKDHSSSSSSSSSSFFFDSFLMNSDDYSHYFLNFLQYRLRKRCLEMSVCGSSSLLYLSTEKKINCELFRTLLIDCFFHNNDVRTLSTKQQQQQDRIYIAFGSDSSLRLLNLKGIHQILKGKDPNLISFDSLFCDHKKKSSKQRKTTQNTKHKKSSNSSSSSSSLQQLFLKREKNLKVYERRMNLSSSLHHHGLAFWNHNNININHHHHHHQDRRHHREEEEEENEKDEFFRKMAESLLKKNVSGRRRRTTRKNIDFSFLKNKKN